MRAIKPREDSDWVKVANSLGGRDAADCLAEAQKRLGWKPQKRLTRLEEDRQLEELACAAGKAKVTFMNISRSGWWVEESIMMDDYCNKGRFILRVMIQCIAL